MRPYGPILCAAFVGIMQRGDLRPREGRDLSLAKKLCKIANPTCIRDAQIGRLYERKHTATDLAGPRRDESRLYERQHIVLVSYDKDRQA